MGHLRIRRHLALPLHLRHRRQHLISTDDIARTDAPDPPPNPTTWHEEYWANVMGLLVMGGYMFVWGIIFAIVVAGAFMLMGALLMWALALLMMIFYPVLCLGEMIKNLFRRGPEGA